ncbi:hypothetical protein [Acuticoccus sediminis]|uniref:hypothetical protein n=1 Tax=Acuticoccus sediminis TaxID=2184697 RepID=UPI001CFCBB83|nr:hypothetical protein [Acuticoccus sediminis]
MQVVQQNFDLYRDNDRDVVWEIQDGAGDPYDPTGVSFFVSVFSKPDRRDANRILRRPLTPGDGPATELVWEVSADRSVMFATQETLFYRLDRMLADGKRKTWVSGVLRLLSAPSPMGDETAFVLQVNDGDEVTVIAVNDTSAARLAAEEARDQARDAQQRAEDARDTALTTDIGAISLRVAALESVTVEGLASDVTVAEFGTSATPTLTWALEGVAPVDTLTVNGVPLATDAETWTEPSPITGDTTYTVAVTDTLGRTDSESVFVDFRHRIFFGASAAAALGPVGITGLSGSQLATGKALSRTIAAAGQYVYVAYPTVFGAFVDYTLFGFAEDPIVTTVNVTTAAGYSGDYYVLRSPNPLTANVPVEVA